MNRKEENAERKRVLQKRYRLDLDDYEFLLYECGLPLRDQIQLFGCRLKDRPDPLSEGEFQVVMDWLRQCGRLDNDYAALAETAFYRLALRDRALPSRQRGQ